MSPFLLHVLASYSISLTCNTLIERPFVCAVGAFGVGAAKEFIFDSKPEGEDLMANSLGIGFSIVIWEAK